MEMEREKSRMFMRRFCLRDNSQAEYPIEACHESESSGDPSSSCGK
jgi:hypothetical protein